MLMTETSQAVSERPDILKLLARHSNGAAAALLSEQLAELVARMEDLDRGEGMHTTKGSLTIDLKIEREKGLYTVKIDHNLKMPAIPAPKDVMWANGQNALVPENPRQQRLPFTEIVKPRGDA